MPTSLVALLFILRSLIRSRVELQLENLALRHQIGVLQRSLKKPPKLVKTRLTRAWFNRPKLGRSWLFAKWVDCTTATNGKQPKAIRYILAISSRPFRCICARSPADSESLSTNTLLEPLASSRFSWEPASSTYGIFVRDRNRQALLQRSV